MTTERKDDDKLDVFDSFGRIWWREGDHYTNGIVDVSVAHMKSLYESKPRNDEATNAD